MENNLTTKLGTINFWIKENFLLENMNQSIVIFTLYPDGGSILMTKDEKNLFKIAYVVLGSGRIDLEYDTSLLDKEKRHMITITWDVEKNLVLYIDGAEVKTEKITF